MPLQIEYEAYLVVTGIDAVERRMNLSLNRVESFKY